MTQKPMIVLTGPTAVGKTAKTKKAIVQLTEESAEIEIFQGL